MAGRVKNAADREVGQRHGLLAPAVSEQSVLAYIIANVPHSIFWKDLQGRFLGGNQNFLRDLGLTTLDELVGKTDYDFGWPSEQVEFFRKCDLEVMQRGIPLLDIEEPQNQADGTHTLLTSKVPLRDDAGAVIGMLGIYVDITERKGIEEALRRTRDAAESASRAKSEFLTVVSHELRTPLTLILGPLEGLLATDDALDPAGRAELERIQRNAARLLALVNDLLAFNTLAAGGMQISWEVADAAALVSGLVADAQSAAARAGLWLSFAAEGDLTHVTLDRRKLEKITLNLVGNALKFTPAGGRIEVVLRVIADQIELAVADTGPGIPAEQQGLLFQRFYQLDRSATRKHEGTGIGLALVKELAEHLGGSVGVASEAGQGARFWVRLPRAAECIERRAELVPAHAIAEPAPRPGIPAEPPPAPPVAAPAAKPGRPRVLIADDNLDMRSWLSGLLAPEYEVEAVDNGKRALLAARARTPTVIVSDVMMPELDGLELVAQLKADPLLRHIPVLLLTAKASRSELSSGLDAGADDYLGKPFSPLELLARVRAACRLRAAYDALDRQHRELQQAHEQLRQTQEQLVHSAKIAAVGTVVAGLCHELNNPLSVILMNTQGLLARTPQAESASRKSLLMIERHTRRSAQLVGNLLDISRKKEPVRESLQVRPLLEHIIELSHSGSGRGKVQLRIQSSPLPEVTVCLQELETALLNLISNALDATPQDGMVELGAGGQERQGQLGLELSVRDHGPGIAADILPHIFDPFFTTKPGGQGTGLGLAITRKILQDHGGTIDVETGAAGTTVRLWLPPSSSAATLPEGTCR